MNHQTLDDVPSARICCFFMCCFSPLNVFFVTFIAISYNLYIECQTKLNAKKYEMDPFLSKIHDCTFWNNISK